MTYEATRTQVETYFDRTATRTWERLTSDAPVSRIRETVRLGRDQMRALLMAALPEDLSGARVLDAGCGTGTSTLSKESVSHCLRLVIATRNASIGPITGPSKECSNQGPTGPWANEGSLCRIPRSI